MAIDTFLKRRHFLAGAAGLVSIAAQKKETAKQDNTKPGGKKEEVEVAPAEDLMREHGLLKRILLIYAESAVRLDAGAGFSPEALSESAGIIRSFIEEYHEKLEEDHLFPRFRKENRLVDLVDVLDTQHKAGRKLTEIALRLSKAGELAGDENRRRLSESLRSFIRMYSPHEAREDTVLFPALHEVFTEKEYDELGDRFEEQEHRKFGENGFEKMVGRVADIEKKLGIYDLAQFTPKV
jgi:hemerythrin-like domain-containing protein